ncbi:LexA family transcriptional regulator [Campylobacter concisus]|uniref:LexA family transcriptional regulator n=1 Tax=Campylobacter concisus TaxID=199 RepID=UPI00214D68B3|nr:LexA family transcriptional regulator [Campylobacter concisus]
MDQSSREILDRWKISLNIKTDKELREKLGVERPAMDKWINRNSIPDAAFKKFDQVCKSMQKQSNADGYWIKKINQKVGAGTSVDITEVDVIDEDDKFFVPATFFKTIMKNEKLRMAQVDGYSMVPMLHPDNWVIFEKTKEFKGDGLYVIMYNDNLMVKILQKTPRGNLYIKSTNKDYESFELDEDTYESCQIIGKVIKCII